MKKDGKIYTIFFTFIVTFIFVFVLSLANDFTKNKVEKNKELFKIKSILNAMNIDYKDSEDAYKKFKNEIIVSKKNKAIIYKNKSENILAIEFNGNGLWGNINGIISVNKDLTRIIGIDFISHSETPGLGGRIDEEWFKEQFRAEKIINGKILMKVGGNGDKNKENGSFDSITGATRTSQSVEKIINDNLKTLSNILGVDKK
ncbi:Na(+)-translocating NADH-quinone reductase subunit C [Tepiditoga spiralis]|uniref:Na(+)-translocating NADH-quinone reductase subunit C n=1 Tax=Tepiditoga spiralis TaxID=2108365 RepID=A0A7G1G7B4_9BACT|nr:FMN-binding protein [Tepiditoga spiralis]BBE30817.1 Na(+)-translocating NADH-quinone reductase subunit C [Tepiditoga spiralis]